MKSYCALRMSVFVFLQTLLIFSLIDNSLSTTSNYNLRLSIKKPGDILKVRILRPSHNASLDNIVVHSSTGTNHNISGDDCLPKQNSTKIVQNHSTIVISINSTNSGNAVHYNKTTQIPHTTHANKTNHANNAHQTGHTNQQNKISHTAHLSQENKTSNIGQTHHVIHNNINHSNKGDHVSKSNHNSNKDCSNITNSVNHKDHAKTSSHSSHKNSTITPSQNHQNSVHHQSHNHQGVITSKNHQNSNHHQNHSKHINAHNTNSQSHSSNGKSSEVHHSNNHQATLKNLPKTTQVHKYETPEIVTSHTSHNVHVKNSSPSKVEAEEVQVLSPKPTVKYESVQIVPKISSAGKAGPTINAQE